MLKNDSTNRIYWKLAKVEELIYSADGKVRAAVVKVANNTNRPVYLRRVIQQLIPIEVQVCSRQITERELSRPDTRVNDNQRPRVDPDVLQLLPGRSIAETKTFAELDFYRYFLAFF